MKQSPAPPSWLPSAEQIEAWLGGFTHARLQAPRWRPGALVHEQVRVAAAQQDARREDEEETSLWALAWQGLREQWAEMLGHEPIDEQASERCDLYTRFRHPRRQRLVLVRADGRRVAFVGKRHPPYVAWSELVRVVDLDREVVWHLANGRLLRLPRDAAIAPLHLTARRVAAARRRHEHALLDRMERGLSRPQGDATAERGLSAAEE